MWDLEGRIEWPNGRGPVSVSLEPPEQRISDTGLSVILARLPNVAGNPSFPKVKLEGHQVEHSPSGDRYVDWVSQFGAVDLEDLVSANLADVDRTNRHVRLKQAVAVIRRITDHRYDPKGPGPGAAAVSLIRCRLLRRSIMVRCSLQIEKATGLALTASTIVHDHALWLNTKALERLHCHRTPEKRRELHQWTVVATRRSPARCSRGAITSALRGLRSWHGMASFA